MGDQKKYLKVCNDIQCVAKSYIDTVIHAVMFKAKLLYESQAF